MPTTTIEYHVRSTEPGETTLQIAHRPDQEVKILHLAQIAGSYLQAEYALITREAAK